MREVLDSNLGRGADYSEVLRGFPHFLQANAWIMNPVGPRKFLSHPLFIVFQLFDSVCA
jgi:hypothetical protein